MRGKWSLVFSFFILEALLNLIQYLNLYWGHVTFKLGKWKRRWIPIREVYDAAKKKKSKKDDPKKDDSKKKDPNAVPDPDDPNQAFLSYGNNPLHDAARDGDMDLLQKILDRVPGAFTDKRFSRWDYDDPEDYPDHSTKNDAGNTPLMLATWMGQAKAVQMLMDHGASVHVQNRASNTPVIWAARHNDTTILEMILEKGVDVNHADYLGFTALHTCAFANAGKPCKMLIDRGANVNHPTRKGHTPIFTAAETHNTDVALVLMDNGADMTLEDENENGPCDMLSGRAATKAYMGEPHQVKLLETMREKGALYHEERKPKQKDGSYPIHKKNWEEL